MDNLETAYINAKKGKKRYQEVIEVEKDKEYYLKKLQFMLLTGNYKTSEYDVFTKHDGKKEREIYKLPFFPDRIVQWALLEKMEPQLINTFTRDTYSAIPHRGIHAALKKLRNDIDNHADEMTYCLKIDCKKFYPSIDHEALKNMFEKKYKDPKLLAVIFEIIDSISTCPATDENIKFYSQFSPVEIVTWHNKEFIKGIGIPIGNYFSQYDGNFYLSSLDHYCKEILRCKYYYRYMDDVCVFSDSKENLRNILKTISDYTTNNLHLRIKENYQIFPSFVRGIDFVGYRCFRDYTLLRKSTCIGMKKCLTRILQKIQSGEEINYSDYCSISSYEGWLKYCNAYRLRKKYVTPLEPYRQAYYEKYILPAKKRKGGTG